MIQSMYNSHVIGHYKQALSPEEDLAISIVENAIYDYKNGYSVLVEFFGKRKAKILVERFSDICKTPTMKMYYRRSADENHHVVSGIEKAILYVMLNEIEACTGKKIRGDERFNGAIRNMVDAEMFFREDDWCHDLCGVSGKDILRKIKQTEGITSQKKQAA